MADEQKQQNLNISISWRLVSIVLLVVIALLIILWRPWDNVQAERKITITGEATVSAEPDELVFYPTFEVEDVEELATKANEITAKLKELGVEEKDIKSNSSSYEKYYPMPVDGGDQSNLTLQLTISVTNNKELSKKVQDYLLTQNPKGQISPQASFSNEKRKALQDEATSKATVDARARAEKMAIELGGEVGKVITVSEATGYGVYPVDAAETRDSEASSPPSLPISVGENDFTYQIQVEFELK